VRLVHVGARCAGPLPQESHGVHAQQACAAADQRIQHVDDREQHIRVGIVEVHLVVAERGPDVPGVAFCVPEVGEQRRSPRTDDAAQVGTRIAIDEEIIVFRLAGEVALEPAGFAGDMIDNGIGHDLAVLGQRLDVGPSAEVTTDRKVVDDRKSVVRRVGMKRQDMDEVENASQVFGVKTMQDGQRRSIRVMECVAVGDQHDVLGTEGMTATRARNVRILFKQLGNAGQDVVCLRIVVHGA